MEADQKIVRRALAAYNERLLAAFLGAWTDWQALNLGGRLKFVPRSRACLVHDFAVQRFIASIEGDRNVVRIERDETVLFVVAGLVALRMKKANERGLGSSIATQAAIDFADPQQELPGIPGVHKVEALYALNGLGTKIDGAAIVARDGDKLLWDYKIETVTAAEISPIKPAIDQQVGPRAKIRLRPVKTDDKKASRE